MKCNYRVFIRLSMKFLTDEITCGKNIFVILSLNVITFLKIRLTFLSYEFL